LHTLAYVKAEIHILRHPGGVDGKHHHVGIRNPQGWIFNRLTVEAYASQQVTSVTAKRHSFGDLAY
jgi:hypothetical protein